jgi:hypothetical protein
MPTATIDSTKTKALAELLAVWHQSNTANWDGQGAAPVAEKTLHLTEALLEALPEQLPLPETGAEPDGQLTLEWRTEVDRIISVSVDPNQRLHYAAVIGYELHHGRVPYSATLPRSIVNLVLDVTGA